MDIADHRILLDQLWRTSPEIASQHEKSSLKTGDVLLGIIRSTKVAVVPPELDGGQITQGTARLRPSRALTTECLAYWLESPFAQRWLHARFRGIDMPGLNLRDVRRLPIPVAPLEEQKVIADYLGADSERMSVVAQDVAGASAMLDALEQTVIAQAFTGKLSKHDPNDQPVHEYMKSVAIRLCEAQKRREAAKEQRRITKVAKPNDVADEVVSWWNENAKRAFSFDELRNAVDAEYDVLKQPVFDILDDRRIGLEQYFDTELQCIRFRKRVS